MLTPTTGGSSPSAPWPRSALRATRVAFALLTRLPVGPAHVRSGDLRGATAAFPLVGVVVGGVLVATWVAAEPLLGPLPAGVLAVLATVALTGAFHEDGLADTVDGLWGGHTPERRVEIMRDSRIGAYGTIALVGTLLLQVALLSGLETADVVRAGLVGHVLSRGGILLLIRWLPAHSDQGSGAQVARPVGPAGTTLAAITCLVVVVAATGPWAGVPVVAALLGLGLVRRAVRRRVGGLVGDVLGAGQQVALLAAMGAVVGLARAGLT